MCCSYVFQKKNVLALAWDRITQLSSYSAFLHHTIHIAQYSSNIITTGFCDVSFKLSLTSSCSINACFMEMAWVHCLTSWRIFPSWWRGSHWLGRLYNTWDACISCLSARVRAPALLLIMCTLSGSELWFKSLPCCHPSGRLTLSSWVPALSSHRLCPAAGVWGREPINGHSLPHLVSKKTHT